MESGFYKPFVIEEESITGLHYAANCVLNADCSPLFKEQKDEYTYPTPCGWYWFNSLVDAETYFGINNTNNE